MDVKVLVIEDNTKLNSKICNILQIENFTAISAKNIIDAKKLFEYEKPSIILLDIMLPGGNGYDLIKLFKSEFDCWVIMMTALNDIDSKKICYQLGADDYITKPFDLFELIYKLNAIKKRIIRNLKKYTIGDVTVNEEVCEIINGNKKLRIPPSHIKFIKSLYEKYKTGSYLSKFELQAEYLEECKDNNRIQTLVSRVRKNLKYIESEKVLIQAIYGKGYALDIIEFKEDEQ
ncbi:response regulator transcription factor [Abyssisolibacter fermentans]|uniref:response regulator transcription factor n=1 Tax=Abyssisolibacter fermentans TaxID=1766203 RepID=UPI00082FDA65|nr:response regulator transcription factor [Abyssisolibacter fermentans]